MNLWTAIVAIMAMICVAEVLKARYRAQHGITKDMMGNEKPVEQLPQNNPALEREVVELRERIKVLERIATEDTETKRLSAEIESLREK